MPQSAMTYFGFEISGVSTKFQVSGFELVEGISELFTAHVKLVSEETDVSFEDVVGKTATLTITKGDESTARHVAGIVSRFEQAGDATRTGHYFATIVPKAWRALQRFDVRIFQSKSVPDILNEVFSGAGITSVQVSLQRSYSPREYCVQYRESDWAFASRLMEEEGIYYFFEHTDGDSKLVLGDTPNNPPIEGNASVPYNLVRGAIGSHGVYEMVLAEEVRSGKSSLTDYNFKKPALSLAGSSSASADADLEVYDYPGEYEAPGDAPTITKLRLEEFQASKKTGRGTSSVGSFAAGFTFTLEDHPRAAFNAKYLLTRVTHRGSQPTDWGGKDEVEHTYSNEFVVQPAAVPFRPAMRTPRPRVNGLESAFVVGPAGEEIHTDEHGRVKVQFHWDRQGKNDDKSSCWIRVSQLWAGAGWGAMFIPRIGHEVLVDFLSGDPDRPVIVGRVYHGQNVPPYALPGEKTKSTIKSNSSPGGGGSNEMRFEDKKGSEEIYLHGQKDWNIKIEHDKTQSIGHDEALVVGHDQAIVIHHDRAKKVDNNQSEKIGKDKTITVGGDHDEDISGDETQHVGGNATRTVDKDESITVSGNETINVSKGWEQVVGGDMSVDVGGSGSISLGKSGTLSIGGDLSGDVTGGATMKIGKDSAVDIGQNFQEKIGKEAQVSAGDQYTLTVGDGSVSVKKDGTIVIKGKDISIKGTGKIQIEASDKISLKTDAGVDLEASGSVKIKGSSVGIN